ARCAACPRRSLDFGLILTSFPQTQEDVAMVDTIRRSYSIFVQSLTILARDKEILIFPFLSGIFTILAFATMVFGGLTSGFFEHLANTDRSLEGNILGYALLFVWYFVSWFIVIFFNVAVIHCAKMRLDGADPTVADGFRAAWQHLGRIAAWALVSATVGLILRIVAERGKLIGKIVSAIVGAAWSIATYFIVPVMIFENGSLRDSVRQSTALISKTWGEGLVAAGGIGAFTMLLVIPSLALPIAGMFISPTAAVVMLVLMVLYWITLAVITSALSSIFRAGLYLYASQGKAPSGYSPEFVQHAFAAKGTKPAPGFRTA
ncbi:MAG: DUF6159 family protein, partial [Thermoanaerobaculia bacterium]